MTTHVTATTPYAWPYDGQVHAVHTALVITGCDPRWAGNADADDVRATITRLHRRLTAVGVMTVLVAHDAPSVRGPHPGTLAVPTPMTGDVFVTAAGLDGFYGSALDTVLRRHGRTHLLMAGFGLETTVHSTLRRANDRGYECLVVADACTVIDPALRHASISSIEMSGGIFGAVGRADDVLAAYDVTSPGTPPVTAPATAPATTTPTDTEEP